MATLYVTEFDAPDRVKSFKQTIGAVPAIAEQTVAIGGSSTQSAAFNTATRFVRLHTDAICSVVFGANPTATATKMRMAADSTEYFEVIPGQKVAVITNT